MSETGNIYPKFCFASLFRILHKLSVKCTIKDYQLIFLKIYNVTHEYDDGLRNKYFYGTNELPEAIISGVINNTNDRTCSKIREKIIPLINKDQQKVFIHLVKKLIENDEDINIDALLWKTKITDFLIAKKINFVRILVELIYYTVTCTKNAKQGKKTHKFLTSSEYASLVAEKLDLLLVENDIDFSPISYVYDYVRFRGLLKQYSIKEFDPNKKSKIEVYCLPIQNRIFSMVELKKYILDNTSNLVFSRLSIKNFKNQNSDIGVRARGIIDEQFSGKMGDFTEIAVLQYILEGILTAPKLFSKIELGINNTSDAIHLLFTPTESKLKNELIIGIASISNSYKDAVKILMDKIKNVIDERNKKLSFISSDLLNKSFEPEECEFIKNIIFPRRNSENYESAFGLFLGYTIDKPTGFMPDLEYQMKLRARLEYDIANIVKEIKNYYNDFDELYGYKLYVYVIPFNDAEKERHSLLKVDYS